MPGFKTFVAGTGLPAADVNGYLMQQANIQCTSSTRPASPNSGMVIYETDTDRWRYWNGSAWLLLTGEGGRATTNAAQAIAATTTTTLNNNGTAAWTATEDTGSFVSATGGTSTPITVPTGKGGLYLVGVEYYQSGVSGTRAFVRVLISTGGSRDFNFAGHSNVAGSMVVRLAAADTLTMQVFTTNAVNASASCQIYCYRIGS